MTDKRLVFLDGIPGSGKSTTAQRLYLHLLRHGHEARWHYEFDDTHPILRATERRHLVDAETVDTSEIRKQLLDRWGRFAESRADEAGMIIFDGSLLQVPLGLLLLMNEEPDYVVEHVLQAGAAVASLNPLLVYLYQEDTAAAISAICDQRQDAEFAEHLVKFISKTPYGKSHQVKNLGDVIEFYEMTRAITGSIFKRLKLSVLEIETSEGDWLQYEQRITGALSLPEMAPLDEPEHAGRYVGRYRSDGVSEDMIVTLGPRGLCLDGHNQKRLILKQGQTFLLESNCIELRFEDNGDGEILRFHLQGPLEFPESEWTKVAIDTASIQDSCPPT